MLRIVASHRVHESLHCKLSRLTARLSQRRRARRCNRVYIGCYSARNGRLVDCGDEGVGGWWRWRRRWRRWRVTAEGCAVKGRRQTGGRHPVLIPTPTHPGPWLTKPLKDEAALLSLHARHTNACRCTRTPSREERERKREKEAKSGAFEWTNVERSASTCRRVYAHI